MKAKAKVKAKVKSKMREEKSKGKYTGYGRGKICKDKGNKAGYTANTSRGRVGRGGNAGFSTFRLVLTNGPTDQWTNGPTDRRTNGRMDKASYRVAIPRLKSGKTIFSCGLATL